MNDKKTRHLLNTIRRDIAGSVRKGRDDRKPQENSGRSSEIREWITIGGLFVAAGISAFQLFEMRKVYEPVVSQARSAEEQVKAAIKSVELAQQAFEVGQRPWLSAQLSLAGDLTIGPTGLEVSVKYSIKNNGNTVATGVQRKLAMTPFYFGGYDTASNKPGSGGTPVGLDAAERKCKDLGVLEDLLDEAGALPGDAIFPAEMLEGTYTVTIPSDPIKKARAAEMALFPAVLVCMRYRSPFDKRSHKTFVSYGISGLGKYRANPFTGGIDPVPGTVPMSSLSFDRVGNAYAD